MKGRNERRFGVCLNKRLQWTKKDIDGRNGKSANSQYPKHEIEMGKEKVDGGRMENESGKRR